MPWGWLILILDSMSILHEHFPPYWSYIHGWVLLPSLLYYHLVIEGYIMATVGQMFTFMISKSVSSCVPICINPMRMWHIACLYQMSIWVHGEYWNIQIETAKEQGHAILAHISTGVWIISSIWKLRSGQVDILSTQCTYLSEYLMHLSHS